MPGPSSTHQSLVLWAVRKMLADGYVPVACDGKVTQFDCARKLHTPPTLASFRPDAFGVSPRTGAFAFGEAKTPPDIDTAHTRHQLSVFSSITEKKSGQVCRLYVAIPRSEAHVLDRVLAELGLIGAANIKTVFIPDCLLEEESDVYA
jgi:hypothetical protein